MAAAVPANPLVAPSWPTNNRLNLYQLDLQAIQADFAKEQQRLFVPDDEINVTVIELRAGGKFCRFQLAPYENVLYGVDRQTVPAQQRDFDTSATILAFTAEPRAEHSTTIMCVPNSQILPS